MKMFLQVYVEATGAWNTIRSMYFQTEAPNLDDHKTKVAAYLNKQQEGWAQTHYRDRQMRVVIN